MTGGSAQKHDEFDLKSLHNVRAIWGLAGFMVNDGKIYKIRAILCIYNACA